MKKTYSTISSCVLLIALALSVAGCSSSQTGDSEFGDDIPADAGTDAVPSENAENAAPSDGSQVANTDPSAQPADPSQAPPADPSMASTDQQTPPAVPSDASALAPPPAEPAHDMAAQPEPAPTPTTEASLAATSSTTDSSSSSSTSSSSGGGSETYHVRQGDTLMRIAFEKYGDLYKWKQIYENNRDKIKDPNVIMPGTELTLNNVSNDLPTRTGKRYVIKRGDTLARISNDVYGTPRKWKKIWEHNKPWIPNPNRIFAGFYLYYTGGKNPEDIERHEDTENQPAPMAQENNAEAQTPREPASQETATAPATAK
jgi:nucleoid-associated protein YgaU